jgi:hypothetical protein
MTGNPYRDPTFVRADSMTFLELVDSALHLLSKRSRAVVDLRFGLRDHEPRSVREVARALGMTPRQVRRIEAAALSMLRRTAYSQRLREYAAEEPSSRALRDLQSRLVRVHVHEGPDPCKTSTEWLACERHGWARRQDSEDPVCPECPCVIRENDGPGRPQKYCSDACRQAAFRRRRNAASG